MIEVKNLVKYYGSVKVIDDVSFSVNEGEIFALVGHSGAGKSTLLRTLNGLENYQDGSVKVFDKEIKTLKNKELRVFRKDVGMIFQHFALLNRKNVFDNVATPLKFWGYEKSYINQKTKELLEIVGLSQKASSYPSQLSGGQKQRVAIARALTLNPKILLSDEATSALDPKTTKSILELLKQINRDFGITVILVTHEMEVVKNIANRAILLEDGKISSSGTVEELFLKPDDAMKRFLSDDEILPEDGVNIRLFFPKEVAFNCTITSMARELDINFNIVWGKLEKLNENVLGSLVINVENKDRQKVIDFIKKTGVLWEVAE